MSKVLPLAIAVAMAVTPAFAQQSGGGLVTVNISNVANDIARDLDVNVSNIPVTVQVPVSVAANVCNVSIDVLSGPGIGNLNPSCDATSTNAALNSIVQGLLNNQ